MHPLWYPLEFTTGALLFSYIFFVGLTFLREFMSRRVKFVPDLEAPQGT